MNNMTTEEKARRYDEAIEKARIWKNKSGMPKDRQGILDDIFPELKESREDEMIRVIKEVILNSVPYKINILTKDTTITAEEAIAWLEKQGEKESDPRYKYLKELLRANDIYQMAMNDAMVQEAKTKAIDALSELEIGKLLGIEKQDEQKLTFEVKTTEESLGIDSETYSKIVDECIYGEQKPAWSEEDEKRLQSCVNILQAKGLMGVTETINTKWLKSLKDRVQPNKEWKITDEDMFRAAVWHIKNSISKGNPDTIIESDILNWFNSLKYKIQPKPKWKPSDGQMVALDGICSYIRNKADWEISQDMVSDLYKLSEQLKKLREE